MSGSSSTTTITGPGSEPAFPAGDGRSGAGVVSGGMAPQCSDIRRTLSAPDHALRLAARPPTACPGWGLPSRWWGLALYNRWWRSHMDANDRLLRLAEELLQNRDDPRARQALAEAHAADIAHVLQHLPASDRATIFRSLGAEQAGGALSELADAPPLGPV